MVHLVLSSPKGNQGTRYFPYSGYLGLTPLKVEGVVRTKLDNDLKQLPAQSITISVRCCESRLGRVNVLRSNILLDYTQVLWSKPEGQDYADIGELEFPFRITIPTNAGGFSTATFVDYRCSWKVEAVIHHVPITGVGSRQIRHYELPLIRYDLPPHPLPSLPPSIPILNLQTNKPRAPRIRYSIKAPTLPIGPLDLVSIPLHLFPLDPSVSIRSASVIVERRIQLNETAHLPSPSTPVSSALPLTHSQSLPPSSFQVPLLSSLSSSSSYSPTASHQELSHTTTVASGSTTSTSSITTLPPTPISPVSPSSLSLSSDKESRPLLPHIPPVPPSTEVLPSKVITTSVAGAESSGLFARDSTGVWNKTLTLQWPAAKSNSRWAIGETIQSELVSVKFFVHVKIVVTSPSGTESIELAEQELLVVSTNETERQLALSKYNDLLYSSSDPTMRSKSKSPRARVRRERDILPPSPQTAVSGGPATPSSASRPDHAHKGSSASAPFSGTTGKAKSLRRPHTSAGPRDKAFNFAGTRMEGSVGGYGRMREEKEDEREERHAWRRRLMVDSRSRPDTAGEKSPGLGARYLFAPRTSVVPSSSDRNAGSTGSGGNGVGFEGGGLSEEVRAWEEELARIELQSRRSSDMLGFACKRKRTMPSGEAARLCPA